MTTLLAVNAVFSVQNDGRDVFLAKLQDQLQQAQQSTADSSTLVQFSLGEDSEEPGKFYLHIKYEIPTADDILLDRDIFGGQSKEWQYFLSSDPHIKEYDVHFWKVADEPEKSNMPNPKCIPRGQTVFCLNANLHTQPEYRDELLDVLENARKESIQEPLCVEYQYGESMTAPNTFHVHQEYMGNNGGKEGFDAHARTDHYEQWKAFADKKPFTKKPKGYKYRASSGSMSLPDFRETERTKNDIIILDGGSGHELKRRGINDGSFLAGLLANEQEPDIVRIMHEDFFHSGCDLITTNSFVAVPDRLLQEGLVSDIEAAKQRTTDLIRAAVKNAFDARAAANFDQERRVMVAGTIPPLTECYMASAVSALEEMVPTYQFLISTLMAARIDVLLAETLSTSNEAVAVIEAASLVTKDTCDRDSQTPLWISFTIDDFKQPTTLRSGESLQEVAECVLKEAERRGVKLEALGVNCASPRAVTNALPCLAAATNRGTIEPPPRIMAYANAFQTTTSEWLASLFTDNEGSGSNGVLSSIPGSGDYDKSGCMLPEVYATHARTWVDLGATIIGGCCGVSPLHMQAVSNLLPPSS